MPGMGGLEACRMQFARDHQATQIFTGRSLAKGWLVAQCRSQVGPVAGSTLQLVVRLARDIEITMVAEPRR
jgi:hypothetical protein